MAYPEDMEKQVDTVLQGINHTYPQLQVFLAAKTSQIEESAKKYPNVKAITVSKTSSLGKVWNQLINEVSTPYTLVARDVVHFTWVARIERQIRMISTTEHVGIAGGSFRNLTGHWRVGCRQTKLFNYVLQYEEGYHYSRDSCMFCDDLEGPFVAKTNLLKNLKFSEKYNKEVIFEEFFLRVSRTGNLILACPDSMYFTTDYSTETKHYNKAIWQPLAKDLKIVRVVFIDYNVRHKFSCSEISYKCVVSVTKYVALPKCCLEQFENAMKLFHKISIENNVLYETDSGSTIACLKFNNYSPFDIDGDIFVSSFNFTLVNSKSSLMSQNGFRLGGYQPAGIDGSGKIKKGGSFGYLSYYTPDLHIEVWGFPYMSADKFSPPELNKNSHYTKCRVGNIWINCVHFPGLYVHNRYGPDTLKHSQSWRMVGNRDTSFARYSSGSFNKCNDPSFHSCLDKFPTDGNIAFKVV